MRYPWWLWLQGLNAVLAAVNAIRWHDLRWSAVWAVIAGLWALLFWRDYVRLRRRGQAGRD